MCLDYLCRTKGTTCACALVGCLLGTLETDRRIRHRRRLRDLLCCLPILYIRAVIEPSGSSSSIITAMHPLYPQWHQGETDRRNRYRSREELGYYCHRELYYTLDKSTVVPFDHLAADDYQKVTFTHNTSGFESTITTRTGFPTQYNGFLWWIFASWCKWCRAGPNAILECRWRSLVRDMLLTFSPGSWRAITLSDIVLKNNALKQY